MVRDESNCKRSSERTRDISEPSDEASKSSRGAKRKHSGGESTSSGSKSRQEEDPKHSRKEPSDEVNVGRKPDGRRHQRKKDDEAHSSEKSKKVSPRKDQPFTSSGVREKEVNGVTEEPRQRATSTLEEGGWRARGSENLLRSPSTTSLYNSIMEGAGQQVEAEPKPEECTVTSPYNSIAEGAGKQVEAEPKPKECTRKESRASSVCSLQSATGCNPTHSLVIAGPGGLMRDVYRSRQTTRSECGSMQMIPGQRSTAEVPPVAVQLERLRVRIKNMDENIVKTCGAVQVTAKGTEKVLEEKRQIKSSIRDLNGAQTETNALLKQIHRTCQQQLEIKKFKLHLCRAMNDTSSHMVEDFLLTMSDNEEDVYGGNDQEVTDENRGDPDDKENNGKNLQVEWGVTGRWEKLAIDGPSWIYDYL